MATGRPAATAFTQPSERPDVLLVRRIAQGKMTERPRSLHRTDSQEHWELLYTLAGRRAIEVQGAVFTLEPQSLAVFRWSDARSAGDVVGWHALHACFKPQGDWSPPETFERLNERLYRARLRHPGVQQRIQDAFGRLFADARARIGTGALGLLGVAAASQASADDMRREVMLMTVREILLFAGSEHDTARRLDARVRQALEMMATDLTARHTLRSLGEACGLSPSRFEHLFREELGASPIRALRLMRLRQAKIQLQYTDDPVERIAEATGFTSSTHLGREFRRQFGVSPRTYRARVAA